MTKTRVLSFDESTLKTIVESAGFNTSLPSAVFNKTGDLLFANSRMCELLAFKGPFPVLHKKIQDQWPFSNEEMAGPAVLSELLGTRSSSVSVTAGHKLKTYKLSQKKVPKKEFSVVVAELQRSGDLLSDRDSRTTLFRTLSHEIRTAVATIQGYTSMIEVKEDKDLKILERMKSSLSRLEKVVERLSDFKVELQVNDDQDSN